MTNASIPLPLAMDQSLRRELASGERLLWSAQPRASRLLAGFGMWLFAIPWTAFALFWEAMVLSVWFSERGPSTLEMSFGLVMPLFGMPFIVVGFWMLWSPIRAMRQARHTIYGLTSLRVLRVIDGKNREVESVLLDQMGPFKHRVRRDGSGDMDIQTGSHRDSEGDRVTDRFVVQGVQDVERLAQLLIDSRHSNPISRT